MIATTQAVRAGFMRRLSALAIDFLLLLSIVTVIGVPLAKLSGGAVRVESALVQSVDCKKLDKMPAGIDLPDGFKPTTIASCAYSSFGSPYNWTVVAQQVVEQDIKMGDTEYTVSKKLSYSYPLSPYGLPTDPLYLDKYALVFFALYFIVFEWMFGGTFGKRILGMRLQSLGGERASLVQTIKRTAVRFGWLILIPIGTKLLESSPDRLVEIVIGLAAVNLIVFVALAIDAIRSMRKSELTWHDRFAATEVVRTGATRRAEPRMTGAPA